MIVTNYISLLGVANLHIPWKGAQSEGDCDTLSNCGAIIYTTTQHGVGVSASFISFNPSSNYAIQFAIDTNGNTFARGKFNGSWKSWKQLS